MSQLVINISESMSLDQMVQSLCKIAKAGLGRYYIGRDGRLPYSATIKSSNRWESRGFSIRYAAISQIGVTEWLKYHPEDTACLPNLWPRIINNNHKIVHIADSALALWAGLAGNADGCELFANALSDRWGNQADSCNAVELAWILQACTLALQTRNDLEAHVQPLLYEAKNRLVALFRPQQNLFQRHNRPGLGQIVSRRIACFADQVYPIVALSNYGLLFDDNKSIEFAAKATDEICRLQGGMGQWWWHYDTTNGKVCEEYPVFSVHQDAMAPMAIMASDRLTGKNHSREIELGLRWLFGRNELNQNLLLDEDGIIWRDIEKCEPKKASRLLRALLCVAGSQLLHRLAGKCFVGFRINRECRPYHLGWILYAWADYGTDS